MSSTIPAHAHPPSWFSGRLSAEDFVRGSATSGAQTDTRIKRMRFSIIGVLLLCAMALQTHAATITVTNTNDSGSGSLRQAPVDVNDGDTINFAVTGTIGLTSGELAVANSITISGPGASNLAIDGNAKSTVFRIASGETVTISGLTITHGHATEFGG